MIRRVYGVTVDELIDMPWIDRHHLVADLTRMLRPPAGGDD